MFSFSSKGSLHVVTGCMFSGKTEELIKLIRRAHLAKKPVQVFKSALDHRYQLDFVISHSNLKLPCVVVESSEQILEQLKPETELIAIDEVQFFDSDVVPLVETLARKGMTVVCAGLNTDWQGRPFHPMPQLLALADQIHFQYAVCSKCGAPATRSQRTTPSTENILVGSGEVYQARCRKHFSPYTKTITKTTVQET